MSNRKYKQIHSTFLNEASNVISSHRLRVNLFSFITRRTALFDEAIVRQSSFDFVRLMLLCVIFGKCNRVARGQLFLMYKIERSPCLHPTSPSRPLTESGYSIGERQRGKTIEDDPAITVFPRRDLEPQAGRNFFLSFFICPVLSYFIAPTLSHRQSPFPPTLKRGHPWALGPVFFIGRAEREREQFERQFVRS